MNFLVLYRYALLSSPDSGCNPTADEVTGPATGAIIIVSVVSLVIHGVRLLLFDRRLAAETSEAPHPEAAP